MKYIDFHCDTLYKLHKFGGELRKNTYQVDEEKLKDSYAQFFALFINAKTDIPHFEFTNKMLSNFFELLPNCKSLKLAKSFSDYTDNKNNNITSVFLTLEGGESLENSIDNLDYFYEKGIRLLTLSWNYDNNLSSPSCDPIFCNNGIKPFGFETIKRMEELNMIIDISHLNDIGANQILNSSNGIIVASHSNSREICNVPRNLPDDILKKLAEKGGVCGINFYSRFLDYSKNSKISSIVEHIRHIYKVAGSDSIVLGSDFDGINCNLEIKDCSKMNLLIDPLSKYFSDDEIEKFFSRNAEEVLKRLG